MLDVDKEELKTKFKEEDWNYVFDKAYQISNFLISKKFKIYDIEKAEDMKQECVLNLLSKIQKGKVDADNNVFAFIWQNSTFRILEILRKETNRRRIANFISYDLIDYEVFKLEDVVERYKPRESEKNKAVS